MTTPAGQRPHRVLLQNPGLPVPDGEGGYTQSWVDLAPPSLSVSIEPATGGDVARLAAGTVITSTSRLVTAPYHPQVTTKTRIVFGARLLHVTGMQDPGERHVELLLLCEEVTP